MIGGHTFCVYLLLLFISVDADRDTRGTPAQEQCKSSSCAKHCSCLKYKPTTCHEIMQNGCGNDGVYRIFPAGYKRGLEVFCDQTTDGGGWQVFQRRFNGTLDFRRKWLDYKFGFGDLTGEFWLGNEHVYNILNQEGVHATLRVDLENTANNTLFVEYSKFSLLSDTHAYRIRLGDFHGDIGDIMRASHSQLFSTMDRDHTNFHSPYRMGDVGWWFHTNEETVPRGVLNGLYIPKCYKGSWMVWGESHVYLRRTEIKFR